jgi:hypothetical protein
MQHFIPRFQTKSILFLLKHFPVVAILGARQVGKSSLARVLIEKSGEEAIFLDLESHVDQAKLSDPQRFFQYNSDKLICLDEVQMLPQIFSQIRPHVDTSGKPGQFLILGSASPELLKQSSESLAGRIAYVELGGFNRIEIENIPIEKHWFHGGFPLSILQKESVSTIWRENFIKTFLHRDLSQLGFQITTRTMQRLWSMLAHSQGSILNQSRLASSLGVSNHTVKRYIELLTQAYVVKILPPYHPNLKKRLVKSPKVYVRDSGILHSLLNISSFNQLLGHPVCGPSFEGFVIENINLLLPDFEMYFYQTTRGAEIDLFLLHGEYRIAIEVKASTSPKLTKRFYTTLEDLSPTHAYVVSMVEKAYPVSENVWVCNLDELCHNLLSLRKPVQ